MVYQPYSPVHMLLSSPSHISPNPPPLSPPLAPLRRPHHRPLPYRPSEIAPLNHHLGRLVAGSLLRLLSSVVIGLDSPIIGKGGIETICTGCKGGRGEGGGGEGGESV